MSKTLSFTRPGGALGASVADPATAGERPLAFVKRSCG